MNGDKTYRVIDAQSGYAEEFTAVDDAAALAGAREWLRTGDYPERVGTVRAVVVDVASGERVDSVAVKLG